MSSRKLVTNFRSQDQGNGTEIIVNNVFEGNLIFNENRL